MADDKSPWDWRSEWRERWPWRYVVREGVEVRFRWGSQSCIFEIAEGDEQDPRLNRWLRRARGCEGGWEVRAPYTWGNRDNRKRIRWVEVEQSRGLGVRGKWLFHCPTGFPWELVEVFRLWSRELDSSVAPENEPLVEGETGDEEGRRKVRSVAGTGSHSGEGSAEEGGLVLEGGSEQGEVAEPDFGSEDW